MPNLSSPLWLLGLGALPVIWWLHRSRHPESIIPVSALFLWQRLPPETTAGNVPARTDPRWLLRGLLFTILLLALAGPHVTKTQSRQVIVWFDDSISMHALENGNARSVMAVDRLVDALLQETKTKIMVRSLGNHATTLDLSRVQPDEWQKLLSAWVNAQPHGSLQYPKALPSAAEHWVVTDGSDPGINDWLRTAPVNRVILVGHGTENAAITRLALRRSLTSSGKLHGILTARNTGNESTDRQLEIHVNGKLVSSSTLTLKPGASVQHNFTLPTGNGPVSARLLPTDALELDDELVITLDEFRKAKVFVRGSCGNKLRAVLDAHPGLIMTKEMPGQEQEPGTTGVTIDCSGIPLKTGGPTIVIHPASAYQPVTEVAHWHNGSGHLQQILLEADWLAVTDAGPIAGDRMPLLSAGTTPLLLTSTPAGIVDVFIDLESPALVQRPVYPVLVSGLIELALGRILLDPVVTARRDVLESMIQPRLEWHSTVDSQLSVQYGYTSLAPQLTALAVLLLLIDILIMPRNQARRFLAT